MSERRSYPLKMLVNGLEIEEVVIDPHFEAKHSKAMNDELILELVSLMDGKFYQPTTRKNGFQYFVADPLELRGLKYRLVWLLQDHKLFVGVVNAFRRSS